MSQLLKVLSENDGFGKSEQFFKYLKQKAWVNGIPLMGVFELTPRCNLNCKMCYVHLQKDQMKQPELSADQWITLIDQACDAGMLLATLTGGECTMHPGFKRIFEHLQSRGILVTVLTNGTLLNEEMVDWLSSKSPERVQVSIYGCSPETYEAVTGNADAFLQVDKAVDLMKKAKIPFNFAVTVTKDMVGNFEEVLRYCKSKEPLRYIVNTCPFESREGTERYFDDYAPTLDQQVEVNKIQRKLMRKNDEDDFNNEDEIYFTPVRNQKRSYPKKGITCAAGRNSFSINWDGKMLPCNIFDFSSAFPLIEGFMASWKKINQNCIDYENPAECLACDYNQVCRFCPAGHYLRAGQGKVNTNVCAEGKRMVAEKIRFI